MMIRFIGEDGKYFYELIKKKQINWNIFDLSNTNISRFDLYYLRDLPEAESKKQLELFLENSCDKTNKRKKNQFASWDITRKGNAKLTISG